ncbi:MAG: hypothetical protein PHH61_06445 [Candidatus Nanoarchaeia archaeon]|nr:hypothetical protein [Candidatus Nanoarchaeia archaeon]
MKKTQIIGLFILFFFTLTTGLIKTVSSQEDGLIAYWESNGATHIEIDGSQSIVVNVTNYASVKGSIYLKIESANSKLSVTPLSMTVNNLEPNVPQTVYFDATNLGVESQITNIQITITAHNTYTGQEQARKIIYATLIATLVPEQTMPSNSENQSMQDLVDWTVIVVALILVVVIVSCTVFVLKRKRI